jgi:20S proteasome alpha/beta subunit
MTVCVAALAENGKKAVLVADKLVTNKGLLPYQMDMAADKIIKINNDVMVMYCGGITDTSIIIENSIKNIGKNKWVSDVAKLINEKHLEYLLEVLSQAQLKTRGIKDVNEFYKEYILKLDKDTRKSIDEVLTTHTLNSAPQFIVCGKEGDGIYRIYWLGNNPRVIPTLMTINYSTIGSGSGYANFSIIQSKYNKSLTVTQVKELLMRAKKEAENDRDVEDKEDVVILGEDTTSLS